MYIWVGQVLRPSVAFHRGSMAAAAVDQVSSFWAFFHINTRLRFCATPIQPAVIKAGCSLRWACGQKFARC